jgi:hypothetical protein
VPRKRWSCFFAAPSLAADKPATAAACAKNLVPLIDPANLATLGKRVATFL